MALGKPVLEIRRWQDNDSWTSEKAVVGHYTDRSAQDG